MPPKASKAQLQQKEKIAVDKTFGMKNKNKSKVVQKYIKSIVANATHAPKGGKEDAERKAKEDKAKDVAKNALLNSLFNVATDKKGRGYDAAAKKKAKQEAEEALAAGKKLNDELRKEIIEGIANSIRLTNSKGVRMSDLGGHPIIHALKEKHADTFKVLSLLLFIKARSDTFWVDDEESSNPTIRCQADVEAEVAPDERSIEEIIEEKRAMLTGPGTPVTLETFKAWKLKREAEDLLAAEEASKVKAKKAASKDFKGLTGRDLFTFNKDLFVDDDGAAGADEINDRTSVHSDDSDDHVPGGFKAPNNQGDSEDEDEEDEAKGSKDAAPVNASLFLEGGGDLPDDLDVGSDDDE